MSQACMSGNATESTLECAEHIPHRNPSMIFKLYLKSIKVLFICSHVGSIAHITFHYVCFLFSSLSMHAPFSTVTAPQIELHQLDGIQFSISNLQNSTCMFKYPSLFGKISLVLPWWITTLFYCICVINHKTFFHFATLNLTALYFHSVTGQLSNMNRYSISTTAASVTTDCQEVYVPNEVFMVVGVASLAENLLVMLAVICTRKLHSPMYLFICNLAAFNTLSSLCMAWQNIMLAFSAAGHLDSQGTLERHIDDVMDTLQCMSFLGSFCSFLVIAVDRYITIFNALRYHVIVTHRRAIMVLGITWTLCGTCGTVMIHFFEMTIVMVTFIVIYALALFLILPLYVHMFLLARKHAGHIASLPGVLEAGRTRLSGWRSMQAALTLTVLFGVFIVCWTPFFLHLLLLMLCPQNPYCECYRSLFLPHLLLAMSHAVIDPTIYAFRSKELRRSFQRMLRYPIL